MKCPQCAEFANKTKGSPVSEYIDIYTCGACGWRKLGCGSSSCDGYLEADASGTRYACVKCDRTGTGSPWT